MRKATLASIVFISLISPPLATTAWAANSASFVNTDTSTMGNWVGRYGADGYNVSQNGNIKNPSYAQVVLGGQNNWTWASSATLLPALQRPENPSARIAGTWFAGGSFTVDVNITDSNSHQVALYALDWDSNARAETIRVLDASTGAVLDSRALSAGSFHNGTYLIWNVRGHVKFEVTRNAGANAVISGLFFGGASVQGGNTSGGGGSGTPAVKVNDFLGSLGTGSFLDQGSDVNKVIPSVKYGGWRVMRETAGATKIMTMVNATGVKINYLCGTGGSPDISSCVDNAKVIAQAGKLLSMEGPNEPGNFPMTYQGATNRGSNGLGTASWLPVAKFQRDLYAAVHGNPALAGIPVFHASESGAETDNVGLQFLTIPSGAGTLMPDGTKYADYANTHNYVVDHLTAPIDNQAWKSVDKVTDTGFDGPAIEYGVTWGHGYKGYSAAQLANLPVVATETGMPTAGNFAVSQQKQGAILLDLYLSAYKRGWSYIFVYGLQDPMALNMGFFNSDYSPKLSATYMHNFTTILADASSNFTPGAVPYSIPNEPATTHDMLMQKSSGAYELAVWGEKVSGSSVVTVNLGSTRTNVKVYDPTVGTNPVQTLGSVSSVTLTTSDHPLIVEFN